MIINSFRIIKEMIPVKAIDIAVIAKENPTNKPNFFAKVKISRIDKNVQTSTI